MAIKTPTTSRRSLLTAAPAAPMLTGAGTGMTGALLNPHPDAELIRLCGIVVHNHAELDRINEEYHGDDYEYDEPPHVVAHLRGLVVEGHRISEEVADMRAATLEGMKAKARVMWGYLGKTSDGELLWSSHEELLGWSIARDLLGET